MKTYMDSLLSNLYLTLKPKIALRMQLTIVAFQDHPQGSLPKLTRRLELVLKVWNSLNPGSNNLIISVLNASLITKKYLWASLPKPTSSDPILEYQQSINHQGVPLACIKIVYVCLKHRNWKAKVQSLTSRQKWYDNKNTVELLLGNNCKIDTFTVQ